MRPGILNPLFASAETLKGVGPRLITFLRKALSLPPGVDKPRIIDLLWHMPTGVIDRRSQPALADAEPGTIATFKVSVLKHRAAPRGNRKAPHRVACEDDTATIDLIFSMPNAVSSSVSCLLARNVSFPGALSDMASSCKWCTLITSLRRNPWRSCRYSNQSIP